MRTYTQTHTHTLDIPSGPQNKCNKCLHKFNYDDIAVSRKFKFTYVNLMYFGHVSFVKMHLNNSTRNNKIRTHTEKYSY